MDAGGVHPESISSIEFFFAVVAREFAPWLVQMFKINVFLEFSLFTISPIAILASVFQTLVDTLYVLFQI